MPDLSSPPLPPSVTMQQQPLTQFSQGAAGGGGNSGGQGGPPGGGAQSQGSAMELVGGLITEITKKLEDAAKILAQEKPQLLPILKPVVQGLLMIQSEVGQKGQGQGMAGGSPESPGPAGMSQQPQGQGAAVSAA